MAGVRIVTDSACDLPQDVVDRHGIAIVPLTIRFGDEEFVDRIDLSASDVYKRMATSSELPQTAAPSPGAFEEAGKQRTRRKAMLWLRDSLADAGPYERLAVCHGDAPDFAEFKTVLSEKFDLSDTRDAFIGATIGTHGGPRILGLSWLTPA